VGHGICLWWLSRQGCLVVLISSMSIKDCTIVDLCVVETLQYQSHTSVSLTSRLFHYVKGQSRTGSGEISGVACTHPTGIG
jgi:hypothetical protein